MALVIPRKAKRSQACAIYGRIQDPGSIRHKTLIPVGTGMTKDKKYLDPATNVQDDIDTPGAMQPRGIEAGNAALIQADRGWIATLHSR